MPSAPPNAPTTNPIAIQYDDEEDEVPELVERGPSQLPPPRLSSPIQSTNNQHGMDLQEVCEPPIDPSDDELDPELRQALERSAALAALTEMSAPKRRGSTIFSNNSTVPVLARAVRFDHRLSQILGEGMQPMLESDDEDLEEDLKEAIRRSLEDMHNTRPQTPVPQGLGLIGAGLNGEVNDDMPHLESASRNLCFANGMESIPEDQDTTADNNDKQPAANTLDDLNDCAFCQPFQCSCIQFNGYQTYDFGSPQLGPIQQIQVPVEPAEDTSRASSAISICEDGTFLSFAKFGELELDIRNRIWSFSYPGRLVELYYRKPKGNLKIDGGVFVALYPHVEIANLLVSKEARAQALKDYELTFSVGDSPPMVAFNFQVDTLLIGHSLHRDKMHIHFRKHCNRDELAKVKYLMVDANLVWHYQDSWEKGMKNKQHTRYGIYLAGMLQNVFPGLKEHTIVYTGKADPLAWWAQSRWFPHLSCSVDSRCAGTNPHEDYQCYKQYWPNHYINLENRRPMPQKMAEENRFGGVPEVIKWDPNIKHWNIPRISTLGIPDEVMQDFRVSTRSSLAEMVMDRAIHDIFE